MDKNYNIDYEFKNYTEEPVEHEVSPKEDPERFLLSIINEAEKEVKEKGGNPMVLLAKVFEGIKVINSDFSDEEITATCVFIYGMAKLFMDIGENNPEISDREHLDAFLDAMIEMFTPKDGEDGTEEEE